MRTPCSPIARFLSLTALVAVVSSACGGSTGPDSDAPPTASVKVADVVGSWIASSLTYTDNANASKKLDVVAAGGEFRITVLAGGGTRHWLEFGALSDEWDALWTISGDKLTATPAESSRPLRRHTIKLSGNQLILTRTDASFDFTLSNAGGVAATEVIVMVRH